MSDPILQEIRAIRDALAEASEQDMLKIAEAARIRQRDGGHKVVSLDPKRVEPEKKAS